jgi:hypothetical protein
MKTIKATFNGVQRGIGGIADFELWTLLEPCGIYGIGFTLSRQTIEAEGYIPRLTPYNSLI